MLEPFLRFTGLEGIDYSQVLFTPFNFTVEIAELNPSRLEIDFGP